jgi:hypothetical protein
MRFRGMTYGEQGSSDAHGELLPPTSPQWRRQLFFKNEIQAEYPFLNFNYEDGLKIYCLPTIKYRIPFIFVVQMLLTVDLTLCNAHNNILLPQIQYVTLFEDFTCAKFSIFYSTLYYLQPT